MRNLGIDPDAAEAVFIIDPIGKPDGAGRKSRGRRGIALRWQRFYAYRDLIRVLARRWRPAEVCGLEFQIAMPASWSAAGKAQMNGRPHRQKPDLDNLHKAFFDCFNHLENWDDQLVWKYDPPPMKVWAHEGRIIAKNQKEEIE